MRIMATSDLHGRSKLRPSRALHMIARMADGEGVEAIFARDNFETNLRQFGGRELLSYFPPAESRRKDKDYEEKCSVSAGEWSCGHRWKANG